jgi:glycosyltransferase involved in cell wall biosynthesis
MMMAIGDSCFQVVLCSHNGASFLNEQITSILTQGDAIEVVRVHDFASMDNSRLVLDRLKEQFGPRIELTFHPDAPGASASFLRALQLTAPNLPEGSLVFLADQDDVWLPGKLATIERELQRCMLNPADPFILFHDVHVVDETLRATRLTYYTGNPFAVPRDLNRSRLLMANPAIGHTMLMSPALIRLIATWPETQYYMMHDWLAILIASRVGRVEYVPEALSLYRQHDNNVLGAYRTRGGMASVSRLLKFTDRMVIQAMSFARAVHCLAPNHTVATSRLETLCRRGYRSAALALSVGAVVRGPTWQRKAIGLLLLVRAIIGSHNQDIRQGRS